MTHNRKLVLGGVDLVKARVPNGIPAMNMLRDELEKVIMEQQMLNGAPFKWIGLIFRYGTKDNYEPEYQRISKKYGDLPIAVEIDAERLCRAPMDQTHSVFREAAIAALIHVAAKYKLRGIKALKNLQE